jgi:tRNA(His) guanylyltransferase
MYNTCFWALVLQGGRTVQEANKDLSVSPPTLPKRRVVGRSWRVAANPLLLPPQGTVSSQKQELLYSQFGINYNNLDPMFRKGSTLVWQDEAPPPPAEQEGEVRWPVSVWRRKLEPEADPVIALGAESHPQVSEDHETVLSGPVEVPGKPGQFMRQKKVKPTRVKRSVVIVHEDIIGEAWWTEGRGKGVLSD